ncbi:MAG: hypothetical protein CMP08_01440 [Xanthomonadales bacterium]|nr:hypothetical protein [Xanthomonadales bacterium]
MRPRGAGYPSRTERLALVGLAVFVSAGHIAHLPIGLSGLALLLFCWQGWAHWQGRPPPPGWLRGGATLGVFACVFFGIGQLTGQTAGVALLALMTTLKLSELQRQRDTDIVLLLCCFVLATEFLVSQSLAMALYLVAGLLAIVTVFVYIHTLAGPGRLRHAMREAATLTVLAVPLAGLCFVLFPRLPGPLWHLERDKGSAGVTGLTDRMSPGAISQLARSQRVALRARFDGPAPPPGARYWRGPVLWDYADNTWYNRADRPDLPAATVVAQGPTRDVTITLEPRDQPWLIALDTPLSADREYSVAAGATLIAEAPINERIRYRTRSALERRLDPNLSQAARGRALTLPFAANPRTRALAQRLADETSSSPALVERAMTWFAAHDFVYTLRPPATSTRNPVDDFLFHTRAGFCEHYAGAMVYLMRAAGVPARVVTGYLGAEPALYGDYWIVRDANAHAWAEVWQAGTGWVRVDPTRAVAPGRIGHLPANTADDTGVAGNARGNGPLTELFYRGRMAWDGMNAAWNQWFLAYGPALQQGLLQRLGLKSRSGGVIVLTLAAVVLLGLASLFMLWHMRPARTRDRVLRAWQGVERSMARAGRPRAPHEPASRWAARVAPAMPRNGPELVALAAAYEAVRYDPHAGTAERHDFQRRARRFRRRRL